jgi:ubiquinone/menaquinone biosynthesis C-methylase UbiE
VNIATRIWRRLMNRVTADDHSSYIRYLREAALDPGIVALRSRALSQLQLMPGNHVVDLGCGPGTVTMPMGTAVGKDGCVIGVDADPQMTVAADQAAKQAGVDDVVSHRTGDCRALDFDKEVFDACYCERVFQHLRGDGPARAVGEMLRILKPGGKLIIMDTDWSTMSIETDQQKLAARVLKAWMQRFANPASGARLKELVLAAGAVKVHAESTRIEMTAEGRTAALVDATANQLLTPSERLAWSRSLSESQRAKLPFGHATVVTVFGTKNARGSLASHL